MLSVCILEKIVMAEGNRNFRSAGEILDTVVIGL